ncbi:MAG: hypothetical protein ACQEWV_17245 [Bacillota bacterium]
MKIRLQVSPASYDRIPSFLRLVNGREMGVKFSNGYLEVDQVYLEEVLRLAVINKIKLMN